MLTAEKKKECDVLLAMHEMIKETNPLESESALLSTLHSMANNGDGEMAIYILRNVSPFALELAEQSMKEEEDDLFSLLFPN